MDGRFVTFQSNATNLVANKTKLTYGVFVRDRQLGVTERVSLGSGGAQGDRDRNGVTLSADGGFVALHSAAINLVRGNTDFVADVFVREGRWARPGA